MAVMVVADRSRGGNVVEDRNRGGGYGTISWFSRRLLYGFALA